MVLQVEVEVVKVDDTDKRLGVDIMDEEVEESAECLLRHTLKVSAE